MARSRFGAGVAAVVLSGGLGACTGGSGDAADPSDPGTQGTSVDPDVNSYLPPSFPPQDAARIVFFGDSITEGVGVTDPNDRYVALLQHNADETWPGWAGDDLAARFPGLDVIDVSLGGATTGSVLASQLGQIDAALADHGPAGGPTLIVGTIGGNDLLDVLLSGDIEAGTDAVIANLEQITLFLLDAARFPDGVYLAITDVYDPTDGAAQVDDCFYGIDLSPVMPEFERLEAEARDLAARDGWALVDMRGHFIGHGFHYADPGAWTDEADPTLWFAPDCIHPNQRGHHEIRRLFLAALDGEPLQYEVPTTEP